MLNEPKVFKTSSELSRKSSKIVQKCSYGLRITLRQASEIVSLEIAQNTKRLFENKSLLAIEKGAQKSPSVFGQP